MPHTHGQQHTYASRIYREEWVFVRPPYPNEEALSMSGRPKITSEYCMRLVGQKVIAYHVSGQIYDGVLHSVSNDGIYLMNATMVHPTSARKDKLFTEHAVSSPNDHADISEAFFPFLFLPLVALAGLAAARPYPYPYPYGYYPGPGYY